MAFKMRGFSGFNKEWSKNEAGYDIKTTRRKNLFGRDRVVEKYYDPETGEKLGKQVTVDRGKNDPRADKVKIKKVNPGLTQSGGVGKIRLSKNPWDAPSGKSSETDINRAQRASEINDRNTTYDEEGNPRIPTYKNVWKTFKQNKDGKYVNPRKPKSHPGYSNIEEFIDDAEAWWADQAGKTKNKKLLKQGAEYGLDKYGNVKFSKKK